MECANKLSSYKTSWNAKMWNLNFGLLHPNMTNESKCMQLWIKESKKMVKWVNTKIKKKRAMQEQHAIPDATM